MGGAQKVFKEKVGPFVNKYCTRCHGSRAKAGINLQSALKNPDGESVSLHWKAVANEGSRHAAGRFLQNRPRGAAAVYGVDR